MADTTISPNMNMPIPTVGEDTGPDWANNINASLNIIDSHNHSSGEGVPINPDGININTDLPFNGNDATTLRSTRFSAQSVPISATTDVGCLYESGVDLYYNDGNGNQIRITQSGSVAGSSGTITGLPSGTASASFAANTFTWQSSTNTPASMNQGPTKIGRADTSGFGVTISAAGSQSANYGLTLPAALPAAQSVVGVNTSGTASYNTMGVGTSGSDFNIGYAGNAFTFNLPDAGPTARGAVTTGSQTFAGQKTFTDGFISSANSTVNARLLVNYATESSGQIITTQFFNISSGGTAALSVAGPGLILVTNANSSEIALFFVTAITTTLINGSGWAAGTGAGANNKLSFNGSTVITVTNNNGGTRTYQLFALSFG